MSNEHLKKDEIESTLQALHDRIKDRFPQASLGETCQTIIDICRESGATIDWISRPDYRIRILTFIVMLVAVALVPCSVFFVNITNEGMSIADFFQMADAILDGGVYIGAGLIFLSSYEVRRKRKRVIEAVNRLRSLTHIIDSHQLTKDPNGYESPTAHSPSRPLTIFLLSRYLDYCTELLSIIGKIAFLYIQEFPDPVATDAVNDLENLTSGISQKIWQKIMIINLSHSSEFNHSREED